MGLIIPPRALTKEEYNRRITKLKESGKRITLRNLDPEFSKWFETSSTIYPILWILSKIFRRDFISRHQMDQLLENDIPPAAIYGVSKRGERLT